MKLLVFTRYPKPGKVKTRLIPALGKVGACSLHKEMAEGTVETLANFSGQLQIWYDGGDEHSMKNWLGDGRIYKQQVEGNLGKRLEYAFSDAFIHDSGTVAAVGTDCPGLTVELIEQAFSLLKDLDLVLGPATDGGYYLIGMRKLQRTLFKGINWGGDRVLQQTLKIAKNHSLKVGMLKELTDVDRPEDLVVWEEKNR